MPNEAKYFNEVNRPKHYNMNNVEAVDVIEMSMSKECFQGYLQGNILKYIIRHKHKGNPIQDLDKAAWYLNKLREKVRDTA